jgi:hypothetical protein
VTLRRSPEQIARRLQQYVMRHLYRERNHDAARACLVAGAARSGTTWLGEWIAARLGARLLLEPFHSGKVPELAGFPLFPYRRPESEDAALAAYAARVFEGRVRHPWIDRQVEVLRPTSRVVKEIRANLCLAWLRRRFPMVPTFLLLRHPCAVVASRLALGWATDADLEPLYAQPELVEDFLAPHVDRLRGLRKPEEKHAAIWCISYAVPLAQLAPNEVEVLHYEDLLLSPERDLARVLAALGRAPDAGALGTGRASMTAVRSPSSGSPRERALRWRSELSPAQVDAVLGVVRAFGLDRLYDGEGLPVASER